MTSILWTNNNTIMCFPHRWSSQKAPWGHQDGRWTPQTRDKTWSQHHLAWPSNGAWPWPGSDQTTHKKRHQREKKGACVPPGGGGSVLRWCGLLCIQRAVHGVLLDVLPMYWDVTIVRVTTRGPKRTSYLGRPVTQHWAGNTEGGRQREQTSRLAAACTTQPPDSLRSTSVYLSDPPPPPPPQHAYPGAQPCRHWCRHHRYHRILISGERPFIKHIHAPAGIREAQLTAQATLNYSHPTLFSMQF